MSILRKVTQKHFSGLKVYSLLKFKMNQLPATLKCYTFLFFNRFVDQFSKNYLCVVNLKHRSNVSIFRISFQILDCNLAIFSENFIILDIK